MAERPPQQGQEGRHRPLFNVRNPYPQQPVANERVASAGGGFSRPPPPALELPARWQRGVQVFGLATSIGVGVWAVLFADLAPPDRETALSPIRRWFQPYKERLFSLPPEPRPGTPEAKPDEPRR